MTYFYVALGICILKLHTATNAQFLHQKLKKIIFSLLDRLLSYRYFYNDNLEASSHKLCIGDLKHVLLDSQTFHWRPLSSTIRTFSNKNLNVLSQSKKISLESPNFHKLSFYRLYTQFQKFFRKRSQASDRIPHILSETPSSLQGNQIFKWLLKQCLEKCVNCYAFRLCLFITVLQIINTWRKQEL